MSSIKSSLRASPLDVAKYILLRAEFDGELISPLKMQKLVYYAYSWTLAILDKRLFDDTIEAWVNGPVVRSLYKSLEQYGSAPILIEWAGDTIDHVKERIPHEAVEIIDRVYEAYAGFTAFQLTTMTHNEKPWLAARGNRGPTDYSTEPIRDEIIIEEYKPRLQHVESES